MSVRKKLLLSIAIISLAALVGYVTSVGDSAAGLEPPPLALEEQASMPVGDQHGPMVCGGKSVTVGYLRQHVTKVETMPPPAETAGSASSSSDPARYPPNNTAGAQTAASSYVFRCVNGEVVAIPAP
jgi:hypothetical protein